jgi:1,4-alpha-glucan branching enzyme
VFTAPGIPMLFQGQEFLEDAWFRDDDPLDWKRTRTNAGIVQLYRALIRLRRNWYDHTRGLRAARERLM